MSKKTTALSLTLIFLLSAYLITIFLQPGDILSPHPVYTDDYSMHLSQCLSTKRFLSTFGKCWGYDPFFLAGFPRGALVNADNKAWELFFFALSPVLSEGLAFKAYLILFLLLYPFLLYAAARNFNLSRGVSVIASVLAVLFFYLSIAIDFIAWGMLSFVFVCYLSIYLFSLFYKLFESFSWTRYSFLLIVSSLTLMMHILTPAVLFVPLLILYVCNMRKLSFSRHLALAFMAVIILLVNSYWLIPVVQFFQDKTVRPENYNFTLQIKNPLEPLNVYVRQHQTSLYRKVPQLNNTFMEVLLLLFGIGGFYYMWKARTIKLMLSIAGGALSLFVIAYYGSHTDFFPQLQPQRFTIPLNIFLIIPASMCIFLVLQTLFKGRSKLAVCFIASIIFVLLVGPVAKPFKALYSYDLYRLSCTFPKPLQDLLAWLENNTDRKGRILIEDSESDTEHQYYGAHFPALFPEQVKREFLCGPRPMYPIKHSYASFTSGVLFEKKISDYSLEELKEMFDLFNVKWIVSWSSESRDFFSRYPGYLVQLQTIDSFTMYEVQRTPSFFLKGEGTATSDYNRIELGEVTPQDSQIIISYHWMQGLRTKPPRKIERVFLGNDPIGFIRILDPPRSLVVYNTYHYPRKLNP
jgi:hypothetical protein